MPFASRIYLIVASLLLSCFIAYVCSDISQALKPDSYSVVTLMFWFTAGIALAVPLWLPTIVPVTWPRVGRALLLASLAGCVLLIGLYGSVVVHQLRRQAEGHEFFWVPLITSAGAVVLCVIAIPIIFTMERALSRARA